MLDNLRMPSRLVAIFFLPVLALTVIAAGRMQSSISSGLRADAEKRLLVFASGLTGVVHELQGERDLSVASLGPAGRADRGALVAQRARTDQAVAAGWDRALAALRPGEHAGLGGPVAAVRDGLGQLAARRQAVDQGTATADEVLSSYSALVDGLLRLGTGIAAGSRDLAAHRNAAAAMAVAHAKQAAAFQRGLGVAVLSAGSFGPGDRQRLVASIGAENAWLADFAALASERQRQQAAPWLDGVTAQQADQLRAALLRQDAGGPTGIEPAAWLAAAGAKLDAYRQEELRLAEDVRGANRATALAHEQELTIDVLVTLIVVAVAVGFGISVARSIVRPLLLLKRRAQEVAERRLPGVVERLQRGEHPDPETELAPVAVDSRDEIGQLAEAFDTAHRAAVDLAIRQATLRKSIGDMFLSTARRSQVLVDRQLELIDELERDEDDPDSLEELFQVDHLATRLRRNAEDLIVLSGAKPTRRWSRPITLHEVVRAATAEVQDYTRIELVPLDDVGVAGQAAADVIHLLAELIENATVFSPRGSSVHVAGQPAAGGYLLEVEDRGFGMTDAELAEVNERLANPPLVDLSPADKLGLYVVRRLAARYGIKVQLRHSWYGGITALVLLPDGLLVEPAAAAPRLTGAGGRRAPSVLPPTWFDRDQAARDYVPLRRHAAHPGAVIRGPAGRRPWREAAPVAVAVEDPVAEDPVAEEPAA
ncbi:MAG TPA: nitrate- and nitrite sensing domain-containing protein, partial [Actinomycetes bacterium]|nr:nitrate- and nitrite sensing domain-containing protein [Actinomycetes bacterium]